MVTSEYPPVLGGVAYFVHNLSIRLSEKGHKVTVITRGSRKLRKQCVQGLVVFRAPFVPLYPFHVQLHGIFVNQLFRSLEDDFDVVHIHIPLPPYIRTSLPTLATVHGLVELRSRYIDNYSVRSMAEKLFSNLVFSMELKLLQNVNAITAVSNFTAEELGEYYGFEKSNIRVLGNGVNLKFYRPGDSGMRLPNILFAGRLDHKKGLLELVNSAQYVCRMRPDATFVIAGAGPLDSGLRRLVNENGLNGNFSFLGHVDKNTLLKCYQSASIFVLPSYYEGIPNVILEAMACGLPVVATRAGGIPEVVTNGKNGFLVSPKNPEEISQAILGLLDDERLRKDMGEASRKEMERHYSWDVISENALLCYKSIMDNKY